jgi:hypothetical protein
VYSGDANYITSAATLVQLVVYRFSGFLAPLNSKLAFGLNRTIPIKFQLTDSNGAYVKSLSAVTSLQVLNAQGSNVLANGGGSALRYDPSANQFVANWQIKGLPAGTYTVELVLADGTTHARILQLAASGGGANAQAADGSDVSEGDAGGQLLGGDVELYVDNSNGALTADEMARIQDAITAVDAVTAPYGAAVEVTTDPEQADVTLGMDTASPVGGYADGILGCFDPAADQITLLQGWDWYAGADPTQAGSAQYDFETTVMHELGHALGLGESSDPASAMYGTLAPGTTVRALTTADLHIPYDEAGPDAQYAARFDVGATAGVSVRPADAVPATQPGPAGAGRDAVFTALATGRVPAAGGLAVVALSRSEEPASPLAAVRAEWLPGPVSAGMAEPRRADRLESRSDALPGDNGPGTLDVGPVPDAGPERWDNIRGIDLSGGNLRALRGSGSAGSPLRIGDHVGAPTAWQRLCDTCFIESFVQDNGETGADKLEVIAAAALLGFAFVSQGAERERSFEPGTAAWRAARRRATGDQAGA